jgi:4,5-DOPA dioxygenase extradiol
MRKGEHGTLIDYEKLGEDAHLSIPTPDHYLPLLYVLGAQQPGDRFDIATDGIELGSISMLSFTLEPQ